jgi:hypothetical protein
MFRQRASPMWSAHPGAKQPAARAGPVAQSEARPGGPNFGALPSGYDRWVELQRGAGNQAAARIMRRCSGATPSTDPASARAMDAAVVAPDAGEQVLQRKPAEPQAAAGYAPAPVHQVLHSSGQPLDPATRAFMEPRFGEDFSKVRIHTDARAAESAKAVQAQAYAVGRNMVFAPGMYAPGTVEGKRLLAHELVHTIQQQNAPGSAPTPLRVTAPNAAHEIEADRIARGIASDPSVTGERSPTQVSRAGAQLSRRPDMRNAIIGSPQQKILFEAVSLLEKTWEGELTVRGLAGDFTRVEVKDKAGSRTFRISHPMVETEGPHGEPGMEQDHSSWLIEEDASAPKDRLVLDGTKSAGDLALQLYQHSEKQRWERDDPRLLESHIGQDDVAQARAAYVGQMQDVAAWRSSNQLRTKKDLVSQGATVTATLPFEAEYDAAYYKTRARSWVLDTSTATIEAAKAVDDAVKKGNYAAYYGETFDKRQGDWTKQNPQIAFEHAQRHKANQLTHAMAEITKRVDPDSPAADLVIDLIESFVAVSSLPDQIFFVAEADEALGRLLGPFGFRTVEGVGIGGLQQERLEYALMNYRRLTAAQRKAVRRSPYGGLYHINILPTEAELQAKDQLVAIRTLPDGSSHTGTLAAYRVAVENNRINHILEQLDQIANAGPASLIGRIVDGERGAALGAIVDSGLMVSSVVKARRDVRAQIRNAPEGGYRAPLDPPAIRQRAPTPTPMPAPDLPGADVNPAAAEQPAVEVKPAKVPEPMTTTNAPKPPVADPLKPAVAVQTPSPAPATAVPDTKPTQISRAREKVGAVLDALPRGYDEATVKNLRSLYVKSKAIEQDAQSGKISAEKANRDAHEIDLALERHAKQDATINKLLRKISPSQATPAPPARQQQPSGPGTAGVRTERPYRIDGDPEAIANSRKGYQVYEYRDKAGTLLYVGKSGGAGGAEPGDWMDRLKTTHIQTEWSGEAWTVTVTSELHEQEAFALEEDRIDQKPKPKYNKKPGEYSSRFPQGDRAANAQAASRHGTKATFRVHIMD